jgi:hypothetical protein
VTRWKAGWEQDEAIRQLVQARLDSPLRDRVLAAAEAAKAARKWRNATVHQDWVLRGRDATRPASAGGRT